MSIINSSDDDRLDKKGTYVQLTYIHIYTILSDSIAMILRSQGGGHRGRKHNFGGIRLIQVQMNTGVLELASEDVRRGFNPRAKRLAEWFVQIRVPTTYVYKYI